MGREVTGTTSKSNGKMFSRAKFSHLASQLEKYCDPSGYIRDFYDVVPYTKEDNKQEPEEKKKLRLEYEGLFADLIREVSKDQLDMVGEPYEIGSIHLLSRELKDHKYRVILMKVFHPTEGPKPVTLYSYALVDPIDVPSAQLDSAPVAEPKTPTKSSALQFDQNEFDRFVANEAIEYIGPDKVFTIKSKTGDRSVSAKEADKFKRVKYLLYEHIAKDMLRSNGVTHSKYSDLAVEVEKLISKYPYAEIINLGAEEAEFSYALHSSLKTRLSVVHTKKSKK